MKCINHGPAFTYASLTNSPDVRSASAAVFAEPLAEIASEMANQGRDITPR